MTSLCLNDDELFELTGYRQRAKQRRALAELGIKFKTRPADGLPLVLRDQFQSQPVGSKVKTPNWNMGTQS